MGQSEQSDGDSAFCMEETMKNRKLVWIVPIGIILILYVCMFFISQISRRNHPSIEPPDSQFKSAVLHAIGKSPVSDLQFRYIRVLDSTHAICLYSFNQDGQLLFDEAVMSKESGEWKVFFGGDQSEPAHDPAPYTQMEMSGGFGGATVGNKAVGVSTYFMIGGFITDPAIKSIDLVTLDGKLVQHLSISGGGDSRFYAYGQLIDARSFHGWQVKAYDQYGSVVSISDTQVKAMSKEFVSK